MAAGDEVEGAAAALAALALRGPEGVPAEGPGEGGCETEPRLPPELPSDVWLAVINHAPSSRCAL